jgi:hypothetical protein
MHRSFTARLLLAASLLIGSPVGGFAQPAASNSAPPAATPPAAVEPAPVAPTTPAAIAPAPNPPAAAAPAPLAPATLRVPEGTGVDLSIDENLSSKTSEEGDRFTVTLANPITLADGAVIPAGYRGRGEVASVERNGMLGKSGKLDIRLDYLTIGDTRVPLRASHGQTGANNTGTTIALTLLVTPLFLLLKGGDAKIHQGQRITAYVDETTVVASPLPPPPHLD